MISRPQPLRFAFAGLALLAIFGLLYASHSLASQTALTVKRVLLKPHTLRTQTKDTMRVMTLNLAHGGTNFFGLPPLLRRSSTIKNKLKIVAKVIKREKPDIIGFQEADAPSWWSGRFHHVNFLAQEALFPFAILGIHVKSKRKAYGTGMISHYPLHHAISQKFSTKGMFPKGFVIATVKWPGEPSFKLDVASVHLHPTSVPTQRAQVTELAALVKKRKLPVIITGDFNRGWYDKTSCVRLLANLLKLRVYKPFNPYLATHRLSNKRLDWILISQRFRFKSYKNIEDKVSDHKGVIADIVRKPKANTAPAQAPAKAPAKAPATRPATRTAAPPASAPTPR